MGIDRRLAPLAAVVGVAVAVAAVVVPILLTRTGGEPGGPGNGGGGDPAALPSDHGPGVPVGGQGTLLRDGSGPIWFCAGVSVTLDLPTSSASCDRVAVATSGAEEHWLIHTTTGGQAYSDPVRVEGTLRAGTLVVTRVEPYQPDPPAPWREPPVPCDPPAGGWPPGSGETGPDDWMKLNRLMEHVRGQPERFGDIWQAHPDGPPSGPSGMPSRMVYVVGTTDDVAQTMAELRAIYPGNLCVHSITRSAAELERIAARIRNASPTIEAYPDVIENKVRVRVVALDPATVSALDAAGRDSIIVEEPLLQWLD
jgi:hypothetical protein